MITMCAWCWAVKSKGKWEPCGIHHWIPQKDVKTTHSICPACAKKLLEERKREAKASEN